MKSVQRLDSYNALRRYELTDGKDISLSQIQLNSDWSVTSTKSGGSPNATISYVGDGYYASAYYVLKIATEVAESVVIELPLVGVFEAADISETFAFNAVCYSESKNIIVDVKLYNTTETINSNSRSLQSGLWGAIRSNSMTVSDNLDTYKVSITVSGHVAGGEIRISIPNLINDNAWTQNPVLLNIKKHMPDFYFEYDGRQTDPTYPMFRYVDFLTDTIADSMLTYSEWFEYDAREVESGYSKSDAFTKSRLTNHLAVYDENLDWLAQFSGTKLKKQIYISGTPLVSESNLEIFKQAQLSPAIYGEGAGTQSAIRTAIEFILTGTKAVVISQRYNGSPWAIGVSTIASETPNIDDRLAVRVASTADVVTTTGLAAGNTIDGITLILGDRVLLKNQTTASQNGVYVVPASGAASRATDFNEPAEITTGALFVVSAGVTNNGKAFKLTTTGTVIVGTTALTFAEFTGSPEVLAIVEPARPMGYSITHSLVTKFTLTLGDPQFGVLGSAIL